MLVQRVQLGVQRLWSKNKTDLEYTLKFYFDVRRHRKRFFEFLKYSVFWCVGSRVNCAPGYHPALLLFEGCFSVRNLFVFIFTLAQTTKFQIFVNLQIFPSCQHSQRLHTAKHLPPSYNFKTFSWFYFNSFSLCFLNFQQLFTVLN